LLVAENWAINRHLTAVSTTSLVVAGSGGSDTLTRSGYITVYEPVGARFWAT